ncbi:hypothetical protein ACWC4J_32700, partial [Streptomyces sp. NPDC001356]
MPDLIKRNFLGMPVSGEIREGSTRTDQKPVEELAPLMQALLDDPTIVEFGWTQYTPYFNDGDVCEFGVNELWVRTTEEIDTEECEYDSYDLELWGHPSLGRKRGEYRGEWPRRVWVDLEYEGPNEDRYDRAHALSRALTSGSYEKALL